jgi:hypothetical protein
MPVPFVPILIGLLALAVIILGLVGLRVRGSVRRFRMVRGATRTLFGDRSGLVRARSAALGVALSDLRQHPFGHMLPAGVPRSIGNSVEREDHRA